MQIFKLFKYFGVISIFLASPNAKANDLAERCLELAAHQWEYQKGVDWDQLDPKRALPACMEANAATPNDPKVLSALARIHTKLESYEQSLSITKQLINAGYPPAFRTLGLHYRNGDGVEKDIERAKHYYKKSFEQGFNFAKISLVDLILLEKSSDNQRAYALSLIEELVMLNSPQIYNEVGWFYLDEDYGILDEKVAHDLFLNAHRIDPNYGTHTLASIYLYGWGVDIDFDKAFDYAKIGEKLGLSGTNYILGSIFSDNDFEGQDFVKAEHYYQAAISEDGDTDAYWGLAWVYYDESSPRADDEKALEFFQKSYDSGDVDAARMLAVIFKNGYGTDIDFDRALEAALAGKKAGAKWANKILGDIYSDTDFEGQDFVKAEHYYQAAISEDGDTDAYWGLAWVYYDESSPRANINKAIELFKKDFDADVVGLSRSASLLARIFSYGIDVEKDFEKALEYVRTGEKNKADWFNSAYGHIYSDPEFEGYDVIKAKKYYLAALDDNGDEWDHYYIANHYFELWQLSKIGKFNELGATVLLNDALTYINKAIELAPLLDGKHLRAMISLAAGIGDSEKHWAELEALAGEGLYSYNSIGWHHNIGSFGPVNYNKSFHFYEMSIQSREDGFEYAMDNLGLLYKLGQGVEQNFEKAASLFSQALEIDPEMPWANFNLAEMYLRGLGVKRDVRNAIKLYTSAANANYSDAATKLAEIYEYGMGVDQDLDRAKFWLEKSLTMPQELRSDAALLGRVDGAKIAKAKLANFDHIYKKPEKIGTARKGRFIALLIAAEKYESFQNLRTPKEDIKQIGELLKNRYGFETISLIDPVRSDITKKLSSLARELKKTDTLLVYYAGHGIEVNGDGFWLPVDSDPEDDTNWLSNDYVTRKLKSIPATNVLLIADSCYSGTISRGVEVSSNQEKQMPKDALELYLNTKSRVVITSGNVEPVLDGGGGNHSVFARGLIEVLSTNIDTITATDLYNQTSRLVVNDALNLGVKQTPTIASLNSAGHVGPDVVIFPK